MKIKHLIKYFCICSLVCLIPDMSSASFRHEGVVFSNGKLSVNVRRALFKDVVKTISEKSGAHIYIFNEMSNNLITTEFSDRTLESGLRMILKEVNYTIVYNCGSGDGIVRWMNDSDKRKMSAYRYSDINRESLASMRRKSSSDNSARKNNIKNGNSRDIDQAAHVNASDTVITAAHEKYSVIDNSSSKSTGNAPAISNTYISSGGDRAAQNNGDADGNVYGSEVTSNEEAANETSVSSESSALSYDADTYETSQIYSEESSNESSGYSEEEYNYETNDPQTDSDDTIESSNDELFETDDDQEYVSTGYDDMPSWYHEGMSNAEGKLRYRIDNLENQIESGRAESEYQLRASIQGEKAAMSPEEQLEKYYDELEEMSGIK